MGTFTAKRVAVSTTCPSCGASHEDTDDVWDCLCCPDRICDRCYADHTDLKHFAELYPDIAARLLNGCGEDKDPAR
jgi:hypothetical protein